MRLSFVLLLIAGCRGTDGIVLSSTDGGVSDMVTAGDMAGCPADISSAVGTSCGTDGKTCGSCSDPCQFCNLIICTGGVWTQEEAFPQQCTDAGGPVCMPGHDETCNANPLSQSIWGTCTAGGTCVCKSNASMSADGKCASACPGTAPMFGDACPQLGVSCSYVSNTTCNCVSGTASNIWVCAS